MHAKTTVDLLSLDDILNFHIAYDHDVTRYLFPSPSPSQFLYTHAATKNLLPKTKSVAHPAVNRLNPRQRASQDCSHLSINPSRQRKVVPLRHGPPLIFCSCPTTACLFCICVSPRRRLHGVLARIEHCTEVFSMICNLSMHTSTTILQPLTGPRPKLHTDVFWRSNRRENERSEKKMVQGHARVPTIGRPYGNYQTPNSFS